MPTCPSCNSDLSADAVLCVTCGYHLQQGAHLATSVASVATESPSKENQANPYRSPTDALARSDRPSLLSNNYDMETRVSYLEERVRELERRIDSTQLMSPNFLIRLAIVNGYLLLGFILLIVGLTAMRFLTGLIS